MCGMEDKKIGNAQLRKVGVSWQSTIQHHQMKKYCLLLLLGSFFGTAMAKHREKEVFALLDSIGQHSFQATFTYESQSPQGRLEETLEGQIAIQNNQYRLTIGGQEVISNGQTVWTYLTEANEVQIADCDPEQAATNPWTLVADCRQDYKLISIHAQQVDNQIYHVIDLLAKDPEHDLPKIVLTIKHPPSPPVIQRIEALDSNQTLHIFTIKYLAYDLKLDKAFFDFNPSEHHGVEIIDMR